MASSAAIPSVKVQPLAADWFERVLALAAMVLLAAALVAVIKGYGDWARLPAALWGHLVTILIALALTPVMLLRKRGDRLHRQLGYIWVAAMFGTALITFDLRLTNRGSLSFIHILSIWTMIQVPLIVWRARQHDVPGHRSSVRGMVTGALVIAGFFTFPFDRLMGHWLFS